MIWVFRPLVNREKPTAAVGIAVTPQPFDRRAAKLPGYGDQNTLVERVRRNP